MQAFVPVQLLHHIKCLSVYLELEQKSTHVAINEQLLSYFECVLFFHDPFYEWC